MLETTKNENCTHELKTRALKLRDGLLYVGVGATIGATLALLFAPKSGSELRSDIADVSRQGYDATVEKATAIKEQTVAAANSIKETAGSLYAVAGSKLAAGEKAVEELATEVKDAVNNGIEKAAELADTAIGSRSGRRASSIM
jgi:gas vesicle protein